MVSTSFQKDDAEHIVYTIDLIEHAFGIIYFDDDVAVFRRFFMHNPSLTPINVLLTAVIHLQYL